MYRVCSDVDSGKEVDWFRFTGVYNTNDQWNRRQPQLVGEPVRWRDDVENPLVEPIAGDTVLMKLVDANGFANPVPSEWTSQPWMPEYLPVAVIDRTAVVMAGTGSGTAGDPISKTSAGVFEGRRRNDIGTSPQSETSGSTCWLTLLGQLGTSGDSLPINRGTSAGSSGCLTLIQRAQATSGRDSSLTGRCRAGFAERL